MYYVPPAITISNVYIDQKPGKSCINNFGLFSSRSLYVVLLQRADHDSAPAQALQPSQLQGVPWQESQVSHTVTQWR